MEAATQPCRALINHFIHLKDPRMNRRRLHNLSDIVTIAICAVICGADTWEDLEEFGEAKFDWFQSFLALPNGIPSHDTFARVFARLDPQEFGACFISWIKALSQEIHSEEVDIISLDGKTLRGSFDKALSKTPLHMVNAWSTNLSISLGQMAVGGKSNEITAVPKLLELLDISGCIVTADALNTQRAIAEKVGSCGAEYVLALKANQGTLHEDVKLKFENMASELLTESMTDYYQTTDADHGRIETRSYWVTEDISFLKDHKWPGLRSIGIAESQFEYPDGKISQERRMFINSIEPNAKTFAKAVRGHWNVEAMHWTLDLTFKEDESRIRKDHAPQNFAILRQIALNLVKATKRKRLSIRTKRKKAGWDNEFLLKVLLARDF